MITTVFLSYYLLPIPCSLFPAPCSLLPVPCSLFPVPYSLLPVPYAINTTNEKTEIITTS
ncbi:hypothetical protein [Moorena producens]|uniref:hypothetical protein n=1 Tax=Moorena producens TaxID=1155739 RepID=UPI00143C399B|nr:hypothetical protein [Moorena producens]